MSKKVIKTLADTNDYTYNLLKAAEELQELSLVLTQLVLKEEKVDIQEVIDELGDVKIRFKVLMHLFDKKLVAQRVKYKIKKFKGYLKKGLYLNKI